VRILNDEGAIVKYFIQSISDGWNYPLFLDVV